MMHGHTNLKLYGSCLEAFTATIFNKIFSGRELHQSMRMFQCFTDLLFGTSLPSDVTVCPRIFYWIL